MEARVPTSLGWATASASRNGMISPRYRDLPGLATGKVAWLYSSRLRCELSPLFAPASVETRTGTRIHIGLVIRGHAGAGALFAQGSRRLYG
jgi:hypothetical protein